MDSNPVEGQEASEVQPELIEGEISHHKLVLLGDTSVGKSCLVVRFVRDEFTDTQEPTIGASFLTQTLTIDKDHIKFEIWDTAGQERYKALAPMYYRGAAAALIVFDLTSKESFAGAKKWVDEIRNKGEKNIVFALAGNKSDAVEERQVTAEEIEAYVNANRLIYSETSAKTSENVKDLFTKIGHALPRRKGYRASASGLNLSAEQPSHSTFSCC